VHEEQTQPAGTAFTSNLTGWHFESSTEADFRLVVPQSGKTERQVTCGAPGNCGSLDSLVESDDKLDKAAWKEFSFEHPASPTEPLVLTL